MGTAAMTHRGFFVGVILSCAACLISVREKGEEILTGGGAGMNTKRSFRITTVLSGLALAFAVGMAVGQNAPTETKGVKISPPTALDLSGEIENVSGRQLRLRLVTFEPGGVIGIHSHKGRPAVVYVLQGTLTEHVEGKGTFERREGESWAEGKEVTHWAENKGDQPVVLLAVDVYKP